MPNIGWGAVLRGEPVDLDDWVYVLKQGFDPWIEAHEGEKVLRSASFDELESASEVRDQAEVMVERLNGAVALSQGARPIEFGEGVEFAPDGRLHRHSFGRGSAAGRGKARATGMAIGPDGQPVAPPAPQPTEVQNWAAMRLSGISCVGGHDGWKGAQPCRDAKNLIFLMPSWTSCWLGPIPRRPLIRTAFSTA